MICTSHHALYHVFSIIFCITISFKNFPLHFYRFHISKYVIHRIIYYILHYSPYLFTISIIIKGNVFYITLHTSFQIHVVIYYIILFRLYFDTFIYSMLYLYLKCINNVLKHTFYNMYLLCIILVVLMHDVN